MSDSIKTSTSSWVVNALARFMWRVGSASAGVLALAVALLYVKQDSLLYFPEIGEVPRRPSMNPRSYRSPSEYNIPFESHMIQCADGISIHAWLLLQKDSTDKVPTILFFHGNAGNIGLRLPNAQKMYLKLNVNILMVEYRGYGDSDSVKPNEKGLKLDSEAALAFIRNHPKIDTERVFIFGRSLGGAVAFHLAQYAQQNNIQLAGLLVENTFLSISKMVDQLMPLVATIKFLVLRIGWNSEDIAPTLGVPILYLAGDRDELVPHNQMKKLYELSNKTSLYAKFHIIRNGTHNDSWMRGGSEYFDTMREFIHKAIVDGKNSRSDQKSTSEDTWESSTDRHSVEIGSGEAEKCDESNSIPIMPQNLMGMAKEASKLGGKSTDKGKVD